MDCPKCKKTIADRASVCCPHCNEPLPSKWESLTEKLKAPLKKATLAVSLFFVSVSIFFNPFLPKQSQSEPSIVYVQEAPAELPTKQEQKQSQVTLKIEIETHDLSLLSEEDIPLVGETVTINERVTLRFLAPTIDENNNPPKINAILEFDQFDNYMELQETILNLVDFLVRVFKKIKGKKLKIDDTEVELNNPEETTQIILTIIETKDSK